MSIRSRMVGRWRTVLIRILRRNIELGRSVRFVGGAILQTTKGSTIAIGSRTMLISSPKYATLGVRSPCVLRTLSKGATIVVGEHVGMTGAAVVAMNRIEIGSYSMLGADVIIADTDFHPTTRDLRRYAPTPSPQDTDVVIIGRNVFLGTGVVVLKGVSIGDNTVVAARSVVSRDLPANVIAGGVPAQVLRNI